MKLRTLLTWYISLLVIIVAFSTPQKESFAAPAVPLPPDTGNATYQPEDEQGSAPSAPEAAGTPTELRIPSLKLDDRVVNVGVNENGEMDVPSGTTSDVGWYQYGTIPGEVGSAVMGAHVYAAFSKLNRLKLGDDIFVTTSDGKKLHFVVSKTRTYTLGAMHADALFTSSDGKKHLNLITCAGKLTRDHSTYDHRLVVYTTLVE